MIALRRSLLILLFISFASCSRQFNIARVVPGQTDVHTALNILNEPQLAERSSLDPQSEVYVWEDVTVQVRNELVRAVHRKPANHEKTLQFWHQHYKDSDKTFKKINDRQKSGEELWQMNIPSQGLNVVYDERNDQVIRITKYETRL